MIPTQGWLQGSTIIEDNGRNGVSVDLRNEIW